MNDANGARTGLFEQARTRVDIEELVRREGVKLRTHGEEARGACPICDDPVKGSPKFAIKGEKWRCYGCSPRGGDVVDLERELRGGTLVEAVQRLLGGGYEAPSKPRERQAPKDDGPKLSDRIATEILEGAQPFAGSLAEAYLAKRGISAEVLALAAPNLRFHPLAKHSWNPGEKVWRKAPAMVAPVVTPLGPTGGVHVTYLDRKTVGKAALSPAKRMWGPQKDRDGRPGGAWLIGPVGSGDLVVAEGIETALSVATLAHRKGRIWRAAAALSLGRLQGGWKVDDEGCIDPFAIQADPEVPAFTWPLSDEDPWGEVVVAVDRDMAELRARGRSGRGRVMPILLNAEARARICGRMAVSAWRAAGSPKARAIAPPVNSDFNDELRRVLAAGVGA